MHREAKTVPKRELDAEFKKFQSAFEDIAEDTSGQAWVRLVNSGKRLTPMIIGSVAIPPRMAKKFESAAKVFFNVRSTRNWPKWIQRNQRHIVTYLKAMDWEYVGDKEESGEAKFFIADFTVHNTLGLNEGDLAPIKLMIARAFHALRKSKVKGMRQALYGDVFLVGKLANNALAWYAVNDDTLYVRPFTGGAADALHTLMHEIGHRYWRKFAKKDAKEAWLRHHWQVKRSKTDPPVVKYPAVGEVIEAAKPRGRGRNRKKPSVVRIEGTPGKGALYFTDERRYFPESAFESVARQQAEFDKFPTAYASTDPEEHFCDALALYSRGALDEKHAKNFDQIWGGGTIRMAALELAHSNPELRRYLVPLLRG